MPFDRCGGVCGTPGEVRCIGSAGSGTGCQCNEGCWEQFNDGPCAPRLDAPIPDAFVADAPLDAAEDIDASGDAASATDAPSAVPDAPSALPDAPIDAPIAMADAPVAMPDAPITPDAGVPETMTYCIDIHVSNTCEMTVTPTEIDIPEGQTAYFCWNNRSRDYPVDVWLSYGGGYTDLAPGATWNERPGHCLGPLPHDEYADITTACSSHRFLIHCL